MRIYYKIWMSRADKDADILSFAFSSEDGRSLYVEASDYDQIKVATFTNTKIIQGMLGSDGIKKIVPEIPKLRASICSIESGRDKLKSFLSKYPYIELISRANYYEAQALLWLLAWNGEARHINIINLSEEVVNKHQELFEGIREEIPEGNALRYALWYKHIGIKLNARQ